MVMVDTRDRLVATTAELFQRQGFNGTSVKQITDGAEATTGSLYHFFPGGKDELAAEVIRTAGAKYLELFQLVTRAATSSAEAIAMLFDGGGNDVYRADSLSQGAAAQQSRTLLHDVSGDDVYRAADADAQGAAGDNAYHFTSSDQMHNFYR